MSEPVVAVPVLPPVLSYLLLLQQLGVGFGCDVAARETVESVAAALGRNVEIVEMDLKVEACFRRYGLGCHRATAGGN